MVTRKFKVYGAVGHRQKESFNHSYSFRTWVGYSIAVINSDITGTNDYSIIMITADTDEQCEEELWGQISDGVFENYRVGNVEEF